MADIKTVIKDYMEQITYQPDHNYTYNHRVEEVPGGYEVYIINSFAEIIYSFEDVREEGYDDEEGKMEYSAVVDFVSCKITPYEANYDTQYYVDQLSGYIENCELVKRILDSVDDWSDPERRTYFS